MAQSYVGSWPTPKGISRAIRKFVMFAFKAPAAADLSGVPLAIRLARLVYQGAIGQPKRP
jgi:hypothetical protein